ncbi:DUF58 domain-containing protein [Aromatoleum petrolei]|uniref:DUF58 domain-containing protein n=1 Tax=Aromatoleum petrolei TaxID=76116 RepID=A0ABX1MMP2_9RHOO|nr:DUF58 domain-containing protein [Aromatoleum petrolei]NMF88450.1 DUF58 domain-containing protein [Aromatoleum petrolei]QTQ36975.1 putative protein DUF58 [Aromatoleum petrolei]
MKAAPIAQPTGAAGAVVPEPHDLIALRAQATMLRTTRSIGNGTSAGMHRGRELGTGLDFAELRAYQAGDDPRNMDWRHTARRGRPFTKLFHEERERPVRVFVDLGPTMRFGTRSSFKSVAAARLAALLAWTVTDAGDRIGGAIHDGCAHREQPARGREHGALGFIHQLVAIGAHPPAASGPDAFTVALRAFARRVRPGSHAIVVSDFHHLDVAGEHALAMLRRAAAIALVQLFDSIESIPPPPGIYRMSAADGERTLDLRSPAARDAYGAPFRDRSERLATLARRLGAQHLTLATHDDPVRTLAGLFRPRVAA